MEVQGKVKVIGSTATFGAKDFAKREIVVTTEEQYPQDIMIEFVQDNVDLLDKFAVGQSVKIGINLRGREWINPQGEAKYFNSLQGWRIEAVTSEAPTVVETKFEPVEVQESEVQDLPF